MSKDDFIGENDRNDFGPSHKIRKAYYNKLEICFCTFGGYIWWNYLKLKKYHTS